MGVCIAILLKKKKIKYNDPSEFPLKIIYYVYTKFQLNN